MAIPFWQSDLYSKTITMWHLWITAQWPKREADRQQIKARRLFVEIEGLGLQQVLQPHLQTPPPEPFLPEAQPPTLYYTAPSQESRYQESVEQSLTPPPTSPPLGVRGNPIIIEDSDEEEDGLNDNFYTAESTFSTPIPFLLHWGMPRSKRSIFWMSSIYLQSLLSMSANAPGIQLSRALKLVTSTIVGDIVTNFSSFLNMCSPCNHLLFFISSKHVFTLRLTHVFYLESQLRTQM